MSLPAHPGRLLLIRLGGVEGVIPVHTSWEILFGPFLGNFWGLLVFFKEKIQKRRGGIQKPGLRIDCYQDELIEPFSASNNNNV